MSQSLTTLSPRLGHCCIFRDEKVFMFGGNLLDGKTFTNDGVIEINIATREWKQLIEESQKKKPDPLVYHSACLSGCGEMIIFGGKSKTEPQNGVWRFRFDRNKWDCLSVGEKIISPRYGHSAMVFGKYLFVFGGLDEKNQVSGQLFSFNLEKKEWKVVELSIPIPGRYHQASVMDEATGDWYILGGRSKKGVLNDFVKIKLKTLSEETMKCESEVIHSNLSENFSRFGHSLILETLESGRKIYSIGGCNLKKDFIDCISLDLDHPASEWEIETVHTLSKTFEKVSEDSGPAFHSNTPISITKGDETIQCYFVFGGIYQNTKTSKFSRQTGTQEQTMIIDKFDIVKFEKELNDDIFRLVLSFLAISELLKLEIVCKQLRVCQLTTEDQYWKDHYFDRLHWMIEASKVTTFVLNPVTSNYETLSLEPYQACTSNYKRQLIEIFGEYVKHAEKNSVKRISTLENLSPVSPNYFMTREQVLKYRLKRDYNPNVHTDIKVVIVGSKAIGKTNLLLSMTGIPISEEYTPTVFDNYAIDCTIDDHVFNLSLWDTSGDFDFDRLRPLSYPSSHIFILSFSCVSDMSLAHVISKWRPEVVHHMSNNIPMILLCTKIDARDDPLQIMQVLLQETKKPISYQEGELLAQKLGCITYLETSTLKNIGVKDICEVIIKIRDMQHCGYFSGAKQQEKKNCLAQ